MVKGKGRSGHREPWLRGPFRRFLKLILAGVLPIVCVAGSYLYRSFSLHLDPSLHSGFEGNTWWLGAASPTLVVHEYFDYECPHCHRSHKKLRRKLREHPDELRIVRHDYARMACAPNDAKQRFQRCLMARAAYCAGKRNKYWEWNDAAIRNPKPLDGENRENYELELAKKLGFDTVAFDECLYDEATIDALQSVFLETRQKGISATPSYVVNGERLSLAQVLDAIEATMQ